VSVAQGDASPCSGTTTTHITYPLPVSDASVGDAGVSCTCTGSTQMCTITSGGSTVTDNYTYTSTGWTGTEKISDGTTFNCTYDITATLGDGG
jgi:hypothetical protein